MSIAKSGRVKQRAHPGCRSCLLLHLEWSRASFQIETPRPPARIPNPSRRRHRCGYRRRCRGGGFRPGRRSGRGRRGRGRGSLGLDEGGVAQYVCSRCVSASRQRGGVGREADRLRLGAACAAQPMPPSGYRRPRSPKGKPCVLARFAFDEPLYLHHFSQGFSSGDEARGDYGNAPNDPTQRMDGRHAAQQHFREVVGRSEQGVILVFGVECI
jgi:hypothetical protein